jgi:hypothetical protein
MHPQTLSLARYLFTLAFALSLTAQAQGLDGVWRGTLACTEGVGAASALQASSSTVALTVTGGKGVAITDSAEVSEQLTLALEGRGAGRVEVSGVIKNAPERTWLIQAEGPVVNGRLRVEAPMFRADGKTLVRRACLFDLQLSPVQGRQSAIGNVARAAPASASPAAPLAGIGPDEDPIRIQLQGTQDPARLKGLIDFLANLKASRRGPDSRNISREQWDRMAYEEARASLAVLNSLGALGLNVYLDKRHPAFKRDLSGAAILGDGNSPVRVLLLDSSTRISGRTLVGSSAMTLLLGTEPAKLQQGGREVITQGGMSTRDNPVPEQDRRFYRAQVTQKLRAILAAKGIKLASPPNAGPAADLELVVAEWRDDPVQNDGLTSFRNYPIVVVFDGQLAPAPGVEAVLAVGKTTSEEFGERPVAIFKELIQNLQGRLGDARFEKLAAIAPADLAAARTQQLEAERSENDRLRQEMVDRINRIKAAVAQKTDLAGVLRVYRRGKNFACKPEGAYCTVKAEDAMVLLGFVRSPSFLTWTRLAKGTKFSKVYDTADDLYAAISEDKCYIVADNANNLNKYMTAIGRDGQFAYNVGPSMNREEASESFAISLGFDNYADYDFAQKIGDASTEQVRTLKELGAGTLSTFKAAVGRMNGGKYSTETAPSATALLGFLDDELKGGRVGKSAIDYRRAEDKRLAEEAKLREQQAAKDLAERAKAFPFIAVLTCGMGRDHINVLACFAAQGSSSVDTELRLTNGDTTNMYKAYTLSSAGQERRDGFYIDLRKNFSIKAQNSHGTLILGLKVIDRVSGKVLFENQAAKFGVLSVSN